jgi:hypothetical protein
MVPMIDAMVVPGLGMALMAVSPAVLGVGLALVVGIAWMVRGTTEELRRQAAREYEARAIRVAAKASEPIAA